MASFELGGGGSSATIYSKIDADYGITKVDDATSIEYYGYTDKDGAWLVKRVTTTDVGWATVTNNGSVTTFTDAWTNRATLTYGRKDQAF